MSPRRSHPEAKLSRDPRVDAIRAPLAPFYETKPTPVPESPRLPSVAPPAMHKSPNEQWIIERIGTLVETINEVATDVAVYGNRLGAVEAAIAKLATTNDKARESIVEDLQEQIASTTREATWRRRLLVTTLISAIGWLVSFYLGTLVHQ